MWFLYIHMSVYIYTYAYPIPSIHTHICIYIYTYVCVHSKWPVLDDIFGQMVADITLDSSQNKWSRELATLKPILQSVTLWWFVSVCFWKLQFSSLIYLWKVGNFPMFFLSLIWNFPNWREIPMFSKFNSQRNDGRTSMFPHVFQLAIRQIAIIYII